MCKRRLKGKSTILFAILCLTSVGVIGARLGEIAPGCDAIQRETGMFGLEAYRGNVVYLDFWASWCAPCRKAMPALNQLYNELKSQGFEVVAINVGEDSSDAMRFLDQYPVDYPVIFDSFASCPEVYGLKGMPTSYLIDQKGIIQAIHIGYRHGDIKAIRSKVKQLLGNE